MAKEVADKIRLPFGGRRWNGLAGDYSGLDVGCSVDFIEHRPYMPGDDVRNIDWRATARTGQPLLKMCAQEVSPAVDILLDGSESMGLGELKLKWMLECLFALIEAARQEGSSCRVFNLIPHRAKGAAPRLFELTRGELEVG